MIKRLTIACLSTLIFSNYALAVNEKHTVNVLESTTAGAYTYLNVEENGNKYWVAIQKSNVKVGDKLSFNEQVVMTNFKSNALNKTFDKIMFAQIDDAKLTDIHGIHGDMIKKKSEAKPDVKFNDGLVVSAEAPIKTDISSLYKEKEKFKNKNVEVQGDVLQVSNKVMGNTWIKIYDGKEAVIFRSTNEDENIKPGDSVKVVGTLNTDVDFGHGYKYEILGVDSKFEILR